MSKNYTEIISKIKIDKDKLLLLRDVRNDVDFCYFSIQKWKSKDIGELVFTQKNVIHILKYLKKIFCLEIKSDPVPRLATNLTWARDEVACSCGSELLVIEPYIEKCHVEFVDFSIFRNYNLGFFQRSLYKSNVTLSLGDVNRLIDDISVYVDTLNTDNEESENELH